MTALPAPVERTGYNPETGLGYSGFVNNDWFVPRVIRMRRGGRVIHVTYRYDGDGREYEISAAEADRLVASGNHRLTDISDR